MVQIARDDWLDSLAHAVAAIEQRYTPEALAVIRAARGAHPYQQCRAAHGCDHPCSCPIRNATTEEKKP